MNQSLRKWLYGLFGGIIGGAATSGVSWMSISASHAAGMDVPAVNFNTLWLICVSGMVSSALLFLKQSPLPADSADTVGQAVAKLVPQLEPKKDTAFIAKPKEPQKE